MTAVSRSRGSVLNGALSIWVSNDNPTDYCSIGVSVLPAVSTKDISQASVRLATVPPRYVVQA